MTRRTSRVLPLALALVALLATAAVAFADGENDDTFGTGGVRLLEQPMSQDVGTPPAADQDAQGRTVVAWLANGRYLRLTRLARNGTDDDTFTTAAAELPVEEAELLDLTVTADRILATVRNFDGTLYLVRFLADGQPDGEPIELGAGAPANCNGEVADIADSGVVDAVYDCRPFDNRRGDAPQRWGLHRRFSAAGAAAGPGTQLALSPAGEGLTDAVVDAAGNLVWLQGWTDVLGNVNRWILSGSFGTVQGTGTLLSRLTALPGGGVVAGGAAYVAGPWAFVKFSAAGVRDEAYGKTADDDTDGVAVMTDPRLPAYYGFDGLVAQADGRVLAWGSQGDTGTGRGATLLRLTTAGLLDPTFGDGGIRSIDPPETFENAGLEHPGAPTFQDDGAVIWPVAAPRFGGMVPVRREGREGPMGPPEPARVLVYRLKGTPPVVVDEKPKDDTKKDEPKKDEPKKESQGQPGTPVTTTAPSTGPRQLRTCLSRRSFTIRVRPKNRRLVSASVTVAGKQAKVRRRNGRLTATVDLRKLEQATFTVAVRARDAKGRAFRETRRYRTCRVGEDGPKVKGGSTIITVGS